MDEKIFSITKENGELIARQDKQITSINELNDLIQTLFDSLRFFSDLRYKTWVDSPPFNPKIIPLMEIGLGNDDMIKIRKEDLSD